MAKFGDTPTTDLVGAVKFGDLLTTDDMPSGDALPGGMAGGAKPAGGSMALNVNMSVPWLTAPALPPATQDYIPAFNIGLYVVCAIVSQGDTADLTMKLILSRPPSFSATIASRALQQNYAGQTLYALQQTTTIDDKFSVQLSKASGTVPSATAAIAAWLVL